MPARPQRRNRTLLLGAALCALLATDAFADPPPWAPAHGRRAKDGAAYAGYSGREWQRDYGVLSGRCNTEEVLTAVGAVTGGVIGNRTARPENRTIATVAGAIIGGVIGNRIGDAIDDRDRACMGHSLELVGSGRYVEWQNPQSGIVYGLRPLRDIDRRCREFELQARGRNGKPRKEKLRGCRDESGVWSIVARR
jgi:surface antigen